MGGGGVIEIQYSFNVIYIYCGRLVPTSLFTLNGLYIYIYYMYKGDLRVLQQLAKKSHQNQNFGL